MLCNAIVARHIRGNIASDHPPRRGGRSEALLETVAVAFSPLCGGSASGVLKHSTSKDINSVQPQPSDTIKSLYYLSFCSILLLFTFKTLNVLFILYFKGGFDTAGFFGFHFLAPFRMATVLGVHLLGSSTLPSQYLEFQSGKHSQRTEGQETQYSCLFQVSVFFSERICNAVFLCVGSHSSSICFCEAVFDCEPHYILERLALKFLHIVQRV